MLMLFIIPVSLYLLFFIARTAALSSGTEGGEREREREMRREGVGRKTDIKKEWGGKEDALSDGLRRRGVRDT